MLSFLYANFSYNLGWVAIMIGLFMQPAPPTNSAGNARHRHGRGYIITWQSNATLATGDNGNGYGVYMPNASTPTARRSAPLPRQHLPSGSRYESDVATHADGNFVVSWRSDNQDGSGAGIYFQRFDASASKLGPETLANTLTASNQYEAKVGNASSAVAW